MKVNSDLITSLTNDFSAATKMDPRRVSGCIQYARAVITLAAAGAAADVWDLFKLPVGAQVLADHITIIPLAGAGSFTAKIGDAVDDDRYGVGIAVDLATTKIGNATVLSSAIPASLAAPFTVDDDTRILKATLTVAAGLDAGDTVLFRIGYKMP